MHARHFALALAAGWLCAATAPATSPRRPEPDAWFSLRIEIDAASLPAGVEFRRLPFPMDEYGYFFNSGATPLYLVVRSRGHGNELRGVPPGFDARYKFVERKAYFASSERAERWGQTPPESVPLSGRLLQELLGDTSLMQVYRDGRPADVRVPEPQPFAITAFYGKQRTLIRGRVIYELKGDYDPHAGKRVLDRRLTR